MKPQSEIKAEKGPSQVGAKEGATTDKELHFESAVLDGSGDNSIDIQ